MSIEPMPLSLLLSSELLARLKAYQAETGLQDPSQAVVEILTQFFGLTTPQSYPFASVTQVEALELKVDHLTQQIHWLSLQLGQSQSHAESAIPSVSEPGQPSHQPTLSYEDIEDEPDEILWDFMPREE